MSTRTRANTTHDYDPQRDLGFGSVVASESRQRLLNRDGSFNVRRRGLGFWASLSLYHALLTMAWGRFLGLVALSFVAANAAFGLAYLACGPGALAGAANEVNGGAFLQSFFFSVHTFATIGYGNVSPVGLAANFVVVIESLTGLLGVALVTGLLFARFSRPTAKILFSRSAVIAPYKNRTAFMFRITNARTNQLVELEAKVVLAKFDPEFAGQRRFYPLNLERNKVSFFPLSWTVVHPIDEDSPLWGYTPEQLRREDAEFLVLLTGFDETFSQTVHTRSSYKAGELIWNAKFSNIFKNSGDNELLTIDINRLHSIEPVGTAAESGS